MYYIYFLKSLKNKKVYVGKTSKEPRERLNEHNSGKTIGIKFKLPVKVLFSQSFSDIRIARKVEYRLKALKSRKIIQEIVNKQQIDFFKLFGESGARSSVG